MPAILPAIIELRRLPAPARTPQALAWGEGVLWISSRDEPRVYGVDAERWTVVEEAATPGVLWGSVATPGAVHFTSGEGAADDRYLRRYRVGSGFDEAYRVALPEWTGSYLSHDGQNLFVSQWYKHRVLQLDAEGGNVVRTIPVGAEICGHAFVEGWQLYVLRGTEQDGESWHLARLDPREAEPAVEELAQVPFACRSLAHDGRSLLDEPPGGERDRVVRGAGRVRREVGYAMYPKKLGDCWSGFRSSFVRGW